MGDLSKNFSLSEFFVNESENSARILYPVLKRRILERLVKPVLQPLRDLLGVPIRITSGYRNPYRNIEVGGKPHSHHLFEADRSAADFTAGTPEKMQEAWDWLGDQGDRFCYSYWHCGKNFIHLSGLTSTDERVGKTWTIDAASSLQKKQEEK